MPHFTDFGGARLAAQPEKESFHTPFGTARSKESFGTFNTLNETTNFRPTKGESVSIIHPQFQEASKAVIHPQFRTGLINPDSMRPIDELTSSFIEKADLMRHAPKDSEYRPQSSIDVVTGKPDSTSAATEIGLQITGEGRRMNIWGNGGASTLEDRTTNTSDDDFNDVVLGNGIDPDIQRPTHPNDNNVVNPGSGGTSFITSAIEAPAEMTSFGKSLNPVAELGGTAGPGASSFLTGQFEMPTNNLGGSAGPGGDDV